MFQFVLRKIFGTENERILKRLQKYVDRINDLEPEIRRLSDEELRAKTDEFRARLKDGETLDDLLVEAFAVVREAARRVLNMRHFDVQLIGGIVLHQGGIAEMATGEGKTLVATLPAYLNALTGKGVHIVTVNDYLAKRDREWMGPVYEFLGLTVGVIQSGMMDFERKQAYACDITYGTNNEFGFDYLRDNMKTRLEDMVQRGHYFAIVDEVDSILIDEARTPLIISGPVDDDTSRYFEYDRAARRLKRDEDFEIDEKRKTVALHESGIHKVEKFLNIENLYDPQHIDTLQGVIQALRAHHLFKRDVDYIVKEGKVILVDEFTGRLMPGRRYSDGLHQALEAKENVRIETENQTLATITIQNYFRMYEKLSGMTGTAATEATEFEKIYNLRVVVIPTNKPLRRKELSDKIYKTETAKFQAVVEEIEKLHKIGRPVLVGTTSIEKSERLSRMLKRRGIDHVVLNAKYHEKEAEIVAQAGRSGAVTIATNMAGRGTDIILGGNAEALCARLLEREGFNRYDWQIELFIKAVLRDDIEKAKKIAENIEGLDLSIMKEMIKIREECERDHKKVVQVGGLHVIGTERHESRRIDNQLRGRAGRQGDPGSSQFFLSLEDDLLRLFGGDKLQRFMERYDFPDDVPIENRTITRLIESAQKKVEQWHFDIRKRLLEYDDVMNRQREVIYSLRRKIMEGGETLDTFIETAIENAIVRIVDTHCPQRREVDEWDWEGISRGLREVFNWPIQPEEVIQELLDEGIGTPDAFQDWLVEQVKHRLEEKVSLLNDDESWRTFLRDMTLYVLDTHWKDHLYSLDQLKEAVGLRGFGQKDPLVEFKKESFHLFEEMLDRMEESAVRYIYWVQVESPEKARVQRRAPARYQLMRPEVQQPTAQAGQQPAGATGTVRTYRRQQPKVGRNDPCPCGSGKKYKKCCLLKEAVNA